MNKIYYGPKNTTNDEYRLSPVPKISITKNINYANDIIIGYSYTININGYVSNFRNLKINQNDTKNYDTHSGFKRVIENTYIVKKILTKNGSCLRLINENGNNLIEATGGILKSLEFQESDSHWNNLVPYTATIEFNELYINNIKTDINFSSKTKNLIDFDKYKIKEFTENWTFDIIDGEYNEYVNDITSGSQFILNNSRIKLNYTISATGRNYFDNDGTVKAAWTQAKDFVQERLFIQLSNLIKSILSSPTDETNPLICNVNMEIEQSQSLLGGKNDEQIYPPGGDPNQIHYIAPINNDINMDGDIDLLDAAEILSGNVPGSNGELSNLANNYEIFNEKITCETSESEGKFSLNYDGIIKHKNPGVSVSSSGVRSPPPLWSEDTIHTVTKKIDSSLNNTDDKIITATINGNIKGLVSGGLLFSYGNFKLPSNGTLLQPYSTTDPFIIAKNFFLNRIYDSITEDLKDNFKIVLGLDRNSANFIFSGTAIDCSTTSTTNSTGKIRPKSINITYDYFNASIDYAIEYTSNRIGYQTGNNTYVEFTSFDVENQVDIYSDHITPSGHILQKINTKTPIKVNMVIQGRDYSNIAVNCNTCVPVITNPILLKQYQLSISPFEKYKNGFTIPTNAGSINEPSLNINQYQLLSRKSDLDLIKGTFTINLSYLINKGCQI